MSDSEVACPRCASGSEHSKLQHAGREEGRLVWQVFRCERCAFTWRSTEPPRTLDPALRERWTYMSDLNPTNYRSGIAPARELSRDDGSPLA
jgi:transposase-like protein